MAQRKAFPIDPQLTAIAIAYKNAAMIADEVMPRIGALSQEEFKYLKYSLEEGFTVPDTKVGRRGRPNEVSFSADEETSSTDDYGLDDPIPNSDIDSGGPTVVQRSTEALTGLIDLDREMRVSRIVVDPDNYESSNVEALAAGERFDVAGSDPLKVLEEALNTPIMRPNTMTLGHNVWSALRRHPKVVKAVNKNSGDSGMVAREAVKDILELEELLVGQARANMARRGQPADLKRLWADDVAMHYLDKNADNRHGTTWGYTAPYKTRIAGQEFDGSIGLRGGQRVRVGESVKEVVSAKALGFLLTNVIG